MEEVEGIKIDIWKGYRRNGKDEQDRKSKFEKSDAGE